MQISIAVYGAPEQSQGAWSAYRFTCAALKQGHNIYRVFFYHAGVWNGIDSSRPQQDEIALPEHWQKLARDHQLDLVVCVSAAKRRGVHSASEAARHNTGQNLAAESELSGLGQYIDALQASDRLITFGS